MMKLGQGVRSPSTLPYNTFFLEAYICILLGKFPFETKIFAEKKYFFSVMLKFLTQNAMKVFLSTWIFSKGLIADDLEASIEEDFESFLNWAKSGNPLPRDFAFEESFTPGKP